MCCILHLVSVKPDIFLGADSNTSTEAVVCAGDCAYIPAPFADSPMARGLSYSSFRGWSPRFRVGRHRCLHPRTSCGCWRLPTVESRESQRPGSSDSSGNPDIHWGRNAGGKPTNAAAFPRSIIYVPRVRILVGSWIPPGRCPISLDRRGHCPCWSDKRPAK
jgi:hypothetical protein